MGAVLAIGSRTKSAVLQHHVQPSHPPSCSCRDDGSNCVHGLQRPCEIPHGIPRGIPRGIPKRQPQSGQKHSLRGTHPQPQQEVPRHPLQTVQPLHSQGYPGPEHTCRSTIQQENLQIHLLQEQEVWIGALKTWPEPCLPHRCCNIPTILTRRFARRTEPHYM